MARPFVGLVIFTSGGTESILRTATFVGFGAMLPTWLSSSAQSSASIEISGRIFFAVSFLNQPSSSSVGVSVSVQVA